jgi:hypothetical protein
MSTLSINLDIIREILNSIINGKMATASRILFQASQDLNFFLWSTSVTASIVKGFFVNKRNTYCLFMQLMKFVIQTSVQSLYFLLDVSI